MNYGSDVQPLVNPVPEESASKGEGERRSNEKLRTVVSTSFYDKLLCVWRFDVHAPEAVPANVSEG